MMKYKNIISLIGIIFCSLTAEARIGGIGFFRVQEASLSFLTGSPTIYKGNCSGASVFQTKNASGVATNVTSNLTVNLSASNIEFYSDSNCTTSITSIVIPSGSSSGTFYFVPTALGSIPITISATNYKAASISATVNVNPYLWTGGGANDNWTTGANWAGGSAPSSSYPALFDGTCVSNCSPTITSAITPGGIRMDSTYTGTITQSTGGGTPTITVAGYGFVARGGTFEASTNPAHKVITTLGSGIFIDGATFNANAVAIETSHWKILNGTFNVGTSSLLISAQSYSSTNIVPGNVNYNNVTFKSYDHGAGIYISNGVMKVYGILSGEMSISSSSGIAGGTVEAYSDITLTNGGFGTGYGTIKVVGNSSQSITATGTAVTFPTFEVASTGGTVSYAGIMAFITGYKVTSGTINTGTSKIIFAAISYSNINITPGSEDYHDVVFRNGYSSTFTLLNSIKVYGTLYGEIVNSQGVINSQPIKAYGNVVLSNYGLGTGGASASVLQILGNTSQSISATGTDAGIPALEIASTGGTVSYSDQFKIYGNYTVTSGTLDTGTSTLFLMASSYSSRSTTVGNEVYNNVTFMNSDSGVRTLSGTMNVAGTLKGDSYATGQLNGGTINMTGTNVVASNYGFATGTTVIKMAGATPQTITASGTNIRGPVMQFASPGGVTINGPMVVNGATTMTAGTVALGGASDSYSTQSLALGGNTFTKNGGTLKVNNVTAGTGALYGGTVAP